MMRFLLVLALGGSAAAGLAACSSSSSGGLGADDAGGGTDGTASHADGSSADGAGNGEASHPGEGGGADGTVAEAGDGGGGSPEASPEGGGADGGDASSPETGAGGTDASDGGSGDETSVDCGASPTLHADEAGTLFCGFDGTTDLYCPTGQECCLGGALGGGTFAAQACAGLGTACPNVGVADAGAPAIPIACAQIADCTADGVTDAIACCLQGATLPADLGCTYPKATEGTDVVCESSDAGAAGPGACAQGEVQMCSSAADCPAGTTCTPGKWKIFQVGFCL